MKSLNLTERVLRCVGQAKRGSDVAHHQTHARAMDNASQLDGTV